jgi:hypothetical protein
MSGVLGGGGGDMPKVTAQNPSKRAEQAGDIVSNVDGKRQKASSVLTQNWDEPILGQKGLVGL